jgi:hypothetical protein
MRGRIAALVVVGGILVPSLALAAMDDASRAGFVRACVAQMYMSTTACGCMADIATEVLDDNAIAYLSLDANDTSSSSALVRSMTGTELASVDSFMASAPKQCRDGK